MTHISKLRTKQVQANFFFVCAEPSKLTREAVHETILAAFDVAGARAAGQTLYTQYVVFAEDDGSPPDTGLLLREWDYGLAGLHYRVSIAQVEKVLKEKLDHESEHKRKQGQVSTKAPEFLTRKTLAILIGSRKFLATNAYLYLERYGLLRARLIPLLIEISGLQERKGRRNDGTYIHCRVQEEDFYAGNFDALLSAVRGTKVMSTEELVEQLGSGRSGK